MQHFVRQKISDAVWDGAIAPRIDLTNCRIQKTTFRNAQMEGLK